MFRLLASLLIGLSLLFSPLAMASGDAVAASHGQATAVAVVDSHCDGTDAPSGDRQSDAKMSCALVCAAVPASEPAFGDSAAPTKSDPAMADHQLLVGIHPEGNTPPPRMTPEI